MSRRPVSINVNPVADRYVSLRDEKVIEYSSAAGGGLISFRIEDGQLRLHLYRTDLTVTVTVTTSYERE